MKITQPAKPVTLALNAPASGTGVSDPGGVFSGLEDVQAILEALASGTLGAYLTKVGGELHTLQALDPMGATANCDLGNANWFYGELLEDCTVGTVGWTANKGCYIHLELAGGSGGFLPTVSGVTWVGAAPVIIPAGESIHIVLYSRDGGTTIWGGIGGGLSQDIIDALTGANAPDAGNVFATMADLSGGSSSGVFKRTVLNATGNMSISTGRDEIDATKLAYLTLALAVGDVVRCTIECQYYADSGTIAIYFDFEVDQPTSGNTSIATGQTGGVWETTNAGSRDAATPFGLFTATEAGVHGFRPMAWTSANTATIANAASGNDMTQVTFIVEKLGQPAA